MLRDIIFWICAPGSYLWFERGDDQDIQGTVARWKQNIALQRNDVPMNQRLALRYASIFAMSSGLLLYLVLPLCAAAIILMISTLTNSGPTDLGRAAFTAMLIFVSALVGLVIPLAAKAMAAQIEWRHYLDQQPVDRADWRVKRWISPGSIDLILALPGFLFFVSIWWGR